MASGGGVQGQDQLVSSLHAAAHQLAHMDSTDDQVGDQLAGSVVAEAPKRTGFMAGTVEHTGATVTIGAPYSGFVEARNPFAARALEQLQDQITSLYAAAVADAVALIRGA